MIALSTLVVVLIACVMAQAFFASAEVALGACDRQALRVRAAAGGGGGAAARIEQLLSVPRVTLATTLVGTNLATLIAVIVVAMYLGTTGSSPWWALLVVPPLLVVGQLVPKAIVATHADRVVDLLARPLRLASLALRPIVAIVGGYAGLLTSLTKTQRDRAFVTRDELELLIESEPQTDKPEISADEREMIANVFELSEYKVGELMVPLSEVTALPEDVSVGEAAHEIADKQHSRMPIYRSRIDDVVGIVHVFDILQAATGKAAASTAPAKIVADLAHPPLYVPEMMKASDLLVQLQAEHQHLAIVVDEYGGAVGIVTIEDLLEIIVGDIEDEHDREPSSIKSERPGVWQVQARMAVGRINLELGLNLPESDSYETIAGLLIERLRHIPSTGETLALGPVTLEVIASTDRAIELVRITRRKK
ncbi:MAG TPA: hemolysin family protein [Kofleriaceae bacterium]|jgi:CBS domain containing-hemolysin-like protein